MAETNKGIYYPTFAEIGEETYDGPVRMKMMAESIDLLLLSNEDKTKLDNIESGAEVNVIETVKVNGTAQTPSNKTVDVPVPTKTSDLNNDSGFIDKDVNNLTNYYDKNAVDTKISAVYKYKGTVSTYNDLPSTNLTIGDVYNIETADSTHGVKAGDNVAWNGTAWDVLAGTVDLSGYQTKIDSSHKLASDLVDDTNSTHKFVTSEEKTQISTNATDIDNIKDGTEINSFGDVETVLAEKQEQIDELVEENSTLKKQIPTAHISTTSTQLTDSAEDLPIENVKLKMQTSQVTDEYVYICDGTETGDYYFEYNNTNYQFTMPTISEGDALVFDGTKLTLDGIEITTTTDNTGTLITLQPAPNPAYPQLIHRVTGDCNAKFVNKNWFDNSISPQISGGIIEEIINTGKRLTNTMTHASYTYGIYTLMDLSNFVGKTIKVKANIQASGNNSGRFAIGISDSDGQNRTTKGNTTTSGTELSFVVPELIGTTTFLYLNLYANNGGNAQAQDYVDYTNIVVTIDNEDMTYTPHAEQNAPLSLGNIEAYEGDEIQIDYVQKAGYKKVTGARLVQNMGKTIFTGEENWTLTSNYTNNTRFDLMLSSVKSGARIKSTHFVEGLAGSDVENIDTHGSQHKIIITIRNSIASTLNDFKDYLANQYANNTAVEAVYELATPVITPITDPTLLAQLEALINLKTYKTITNINCTGEDLAPVLDCDYYQDMSTLNDRLDTLEARIELLEE